ncbi:porin [Myxococcaceae bacterium GXIMD 01537]
MPEPAPEPGRLVLATPVGPITVGGRIDVRESLERPLSGDWAGKLGVAAARLEFTYRWKKSLRAVVEFDASDAELKDAFVWLRASKGLAFRAGRFKVPLSLFELESASSLPLVRRGLLREVQTDVLGLSGRKPGAQVEWKCAGCTHDVKLRAGVWQTQDPDKKVALSKGLGLIPTVRGTWELGTFQLGASALLQPPGTISGSDRYSATGALDLQHFLPLGGSALRTWAEVLGGRSAALGDTEGLFLMGRALLGLRLGGGAPGDTYLEPFVMLSGFDPDLDRDDDRIWEGAAGLNVGQWERWRVQAQFEAREVDPSVPALLRTLDEDLVARRALLVQLEVSF